MDQETTTTPKLWPESVNITLEPKTFAFPKLKLIPTWPGRTLIENQHKKFTTTLNIRQMDRWDDK